MGTTKTEDFSKTTTEMALVLKALGHPARFEIINLIQTEKECLNSKILEKISLSQSTISKHISELKNAGLIETKSSGNFLTYSINELIWKKLENYFNPLYFESFEVLDDFEVVVKKSDSKKPSKKNMNLKKNNYEFKHLILKSKNV